MNKLILLQSSNFGNTKCDFYKNNQEDILMTRTQIGQALEYKNSNDAIRLIHERHKKRLDKFSIVQIERGQELYLYTPKGVYEICRWSHQPKADDFLDWVWDVIEKIRKMDKITLEHLIKREVGKITRKTLTDAIKQLPDSPNKKFKYKLFTDLMYKTIFNKNAKQLREQFGISKKDNLRDCFSTDEIKKVEYIENQISVLLEFGNDYKTIKAILEKKYLMSA